MVQDPLHPSCPLGLSKINPPLPVSLVSIPGGTQLGLWMPASCPPAEQTTIQLLPAKVNPRQGGRRGRPESGGHGRGAVWPKGKSRCGAGGD